MSAPTARASVGLFKRLWNEYPEIVGSTFMGAIGVVLGVAAVVNYTNKDGDVKRYRYEYTVVRDDDPYAKYVKKD